MRHALLTLLIFTSLSVSAQQSIKGGMAAFDRGDYEDAVNILSQEMEHPDRLKAKDRANGWYYLGLAKSTLISNAMSIQDATALDRFKGYDLDAYFCFKQALNEEQNASIKDEITEQIQTLSYVIFNSGNLKYMMSEYSFALKYYNAAEEIAETYGMYKDYQVYQFKGQVKLELKDSTDAYVYYGKAIERYRKEKPEIPDPNIGYAYYTKAVIDRYSKNDLDKALKGVQEGTELIDAEANRLGEILSSEGNSAMSLQGLDEQFVNVRDALSRFELDIYNASPEKYDEAVAKFQKAIAENPNDANMLLVYGNLIEYKDPKGALEAYKKVTEISPQNAIGFFNAGALLVNEGVQYARKGNEEFDFQKAEEWRQKTNEAFSKALPYLETAHSLEPDNIYVIDALLQVTIQLELMDEYKMYKDKQTELRGY